MNQQQIPTQLPPTLYKFFWDVDAARVDPSRSTKYVVNRLLDKGNLEAVRWVLQNYSRKTVIKSLRHGPAVDPPTAAFFSSFLHISRKNISTKKHYKRIPDLNLWPFGNLN